MYERLKNDEYRLFRLYYVLSELDSITNRMKEKFISSIPELEFVVETQKDKKILYGAGNIGRCVLEIFGDKVSYFADGDLRKQGKSINGVYILSKNEMMDMLNNSEDYHVVISVTYEKQLEIIRTLVDLGIKELSIYKNILLMV